MMMMMMYSPLWFEGGSTRPAGQQNVLQGELKEKFPCQNPSMRLMERMWIRAGKGSGLQWGEPVYLALNVACCTIFYILMDKTWPGGALQDEASSHNQSKCSSSLLLYIIPHTLCTNGTCSNL